MLNKEAADLQSGASTDSGIGICNNLVSLFSGLHRYHIPVLTPAEDSTDGRFGLKDSVSIVLTSSRKPQTSSQGPPPTLA